jgi:hypothetical protein
LFHLDGTKKSVGTPVNSVCNYGEDNKNPERGRLVIEAPGCSQEWGTNLTAYCCIPPLHHRQQAARWGLSQAISDLTKHCKIQMLKLQKITEKVELVFQLQTSITITIYSLLLS